MNFKVSKLRGIFSKIAHCGSGNPPFRPSPPPSLIKLPTVATSKSPKITIAETTKIATNASGNFLVICGKPNIMAIVKPTSPTIVHNEAPCIHTISPFSEVMNILNCERKITIANPFTNPIMTGCGIKRTNLPSLKTPAIT